MSAGVDPRLQKPILDSMAQSRPDAILITPTDRTAVQNPLAQDARTSKVVLIDTTVDGPGLADAVYRSRC